MEEKQKKSLWIKKEFKTMVVLLRNIPSPVVALFVVSVITMNLLANKTIFMNDVIAVDGGILVSWLSFLSMDIVTKHYGPASSIRMSVFATFVNLLTCLIFFIASIIPGAQGEDYTAFNTIIGGTWFILLDSTIAFLCSAIINNFLNFSVGKLFKNNPDGKLAYFTRSYVSTFVAQFFDNLIFQVLTFMLFAPIFWDGFSWTLIQCITCSILGAVLELLFEVVFSPIGYKVVKTWQNQNVGKEYFDYIKEIEK